MRKKTKFISLKWPLVLIVALGLLSRLPYLPFKIDDAFIYAQYATNFARGLGLVFNEGERVLAITSPLYALLLSLVIRAVSDPVLAANIIALLLYVTAQIVVWQLCVSIFRDRRAVILASLLFALGDVSNRWWMSGMETPLYVTLALWCLLAASRRRTILAGLLAGLAILGRPDGILLVPLLIFREWFSVREGTADASHGSFWPRALKLATAIIFPIVPWLAFSLWYYGTPLQSSMVSKMSLGAATYGTYHYLFQSYQLNLKGYAACLFFLMPAILTVLFFLRKRNLTGILLAAWSTGQLCAYLVMLRPIAYWYLAPGFMGIYLLAGHGFILAVDGLTFVDAHKPAVDETTQHASGQEQIKLRPPWRLPRALPALAVAYAILFNVGFTALSRKNARDLWEGYGQIAESIRNASSSEALIAAGDVGLLGLVSRRRILDYGGLLHPEVLESYRDGSLDRFVLDREPEFIVLSTESMTTEPYRRISDSKTFKQRYREFMRRTAFRQEYVVFRRIDH